MAFFPPLSARRLLRSLRSYMTAGGGAIMIDACVWSQKATSRLLWCNVVCVHVCVRVCARTHARVYEGEALRAKLQGFWKRSLFNILVCIYLWAANLEFLSEYFSHVDLANIFYQKKKKMKRKETKQNKNYAPDISHCQENKSNESSLFK